MSRCYICWKKAGFIILDEPQPFSTPMEGRDAAVITNASQRPVGDFSAMLELGQARKPMVGADEKSCYWVIPLPRPSPCPELSNVSTLWPSTEKGRDEAEVLSMCWGPGYTRHQRSIRVVWSRCHSRDSFPWAALPNIGTRKHTDQGLVSVSVPQTARSHVWSLKHKAFKEKQWSIWRMQKITDKMERQENIIHRQTWTKES